jgi:hypothetical protein
MKKRTPQSLTPQSLTPQSRTTQSRTQQSIDKAHQLPRVDDAALAQIIGGVEFGVSAPTDATVTLNRWYSGNMPPGGGN